MNVGLLARVVPEGSGAFDSKIANLTPSTIFVFGGSALTFRQAVTVHLGEIALHGEVALISRRPRGALISFRPSEDALHQIEDIMDDVRVIQVGSGKTSLEDLSQLSDADLDALVDEDPEGPTNTEGEPLDIDDTESAAAEVRGALARAIPPSVTERLTEDIVRPRTRTEPDAGGNVTARAPTVIDAAADE